MDGLGWSSQLRRDVRGLLGSLLGAPGPVFTARAPGARHLLAQRGTGGVRASGPGLPAIPVVPVVVREEAQEGGVRVTLRVAGVEHTVEPEAGETLLEAGLRAGVAMPFSCAAGGCGTCKVRLRSGEVVLDSPHCLTDDERAEGYVLTCVGRARGSCTLDIPEDPEVG